MMVPLQVGLFACLVIPIAATVVTWISIETRQRWIRDVAAITGTAVEFLIAAVLAAILRMQQDADVSEIPLQRFRWLGDSGPHGLSLEFGLEATFAKLAVISLTSLISLIAVIRKATQKHTRFGDGIVLAINCLNAAGVIFLCAPNLGQALFAWAAIGFVAAVLIRLTRLETALGNKSDGTISAQGLVETNVATEGQFTTRWQQTVSRITKGAERILRDQFRHRLGIQFPAWLMEQIELLETGTVTFQLTTTLLFASTLLLTWLAISV